MFTFVIMCSCGMKLCVGSSRESSLCASKVLWVVGLHSEVIDAEVVCRTLC